MTGPAAFDASGASYDAFVGRYSVPLAAALADFAGLGEGQQPDLLGAADIGCGPGAMTSVLATRLGPDRVVACDPSPPFVAECARRNPGVRVVVGRAEALPWAAASQDLVTAELVLHFVSDPELAAREAARVLRPGGIFAACVWDFAEGMTMLRAFWEAARELDPAAPDEATTMRFGRAGELAALLAAAGFTEVAETTLRVQASYDDFDQLWAGFEQGVGPAGSYLMAGSLEQQAELRRLTFDRLGRPNAGFTLSAVAHSVRGARPSGSGHELEGA